MAAAGGNWLIVRHVVSWVTITPPRVWLWVAEFLYRGFTNRTSIIVLANQKSTRVESDNICA